ncbi:MAG: glutamine amidotransferase [Metallibacterium scheffleri]|jgi:GMP synthase (glutamine-hydrolysing)|uniref:glutamine amidotransferase n=1 Tax=Metallibacterium scheffleri TaxID=993689 RepID=UPI0026EE7102|nr:glutamine amidotransferase [Metallibacterium scheffleri]MCK9366620.1 glutamine amidotransferase [Metallibacterium scheffleri]
MRPLLIVATGTPPPEIRARHGDYTDWFLHALRWPRAQARVVQVDHDEPLPSPRDIAGAVITGSAAMVSERAAWSERTAAWLRAAMDANLPLFGVCYGHHLLAHALGGRVDYHPQGREIGTQMIELLEADTALHALAPLPARFPAHTTHRQSVLETPPGARVLARSVHDAHHILAYGERAFSTQFHPEFSTAVMRALILRRAADLRAEGYDLDALLHEVRPTPWARRLLRGFARLCHGEVAVIASSGTRAAA